MPSAFPPELLAAKEKLARLCEGEFAPAHLVESVDEVARLRENLPNGLHPFMVANQQTWTDVYALDLSSSPPAVVVWADHAIVERWENFEAFLRWVQAFGENPKA